MSVRLRVDRHVGEGHAAAVGRDLRIGDPGETQQVIFAHGVGGAPAAQRRAATVTGRKISTFFQQVLVISNTTRKLDFALLEAAMTLGTKRWRLITRVVVPGILPDLYRDQRVLLAWA